MSSIVLNLDAESLNEVIYGMKLLKEAVGKVRDAEAVKLDIKYSQREDWLLNISRKIFFNFIAEDRSVYIGNDGNEIKKIIFDVDELYYEEHLERALNLIESDLDIPSCCICEGCEDCKIFIEKYFSKFGLYERRVKFHSNVKTANMDVGFLKYIPKLLDDRILSNYLVYKISIDKDSEEVVIKYIDEKSQYYGEEPESLDIIKELRRFIEESINYIGVFNDRHIKRA